MVRALYGDPPLNSGPNAKTPWLTRLKADGVFLLDLAAEPVTYHGAGERAAALRRNIEATVTQASSQGPEGIVLVKRNVFELLNAPCAAPASPHFTTTSSRSRAVVSSADSASCSHRRSAHWMATRQREEGGTGRGAAKHSIQSMLPSRAVASK